MTVYNNNINLYTTFYPGRLSSCNDKIINLARSISSLVSARDYFAVLDMTSTCCALTEA